MLASSLMPLKTQNMEIPIGQFSNQNSGDNNEPGQFEKSDKTGEQYPISERTALNAVDKANKVLNLSDRRLEYSVHEATKRVIVKVVNSSTGEIVREIPSEKILDMAASMGKTSGILVDEKR